MSEQTTARTVREMSDEDLIYQFAEASVDVDDHRLLYDTLATELLSRLTAAERSTAGADTELIPNLTVSALMAVSNERNRQRAKWGTQRHSWPEWMAILGEEYGEACKEAVESHWGGPESLAATEQLRMELVQLAAVAVQIIEHIDELTEATDDR